MHLSPQGLFSWISTMGDRFRVRSRPDPDLLAAIELVVDVADPDIRQVRGYRQELRGPVSAAMAYCDSLVDKLPGPVRLSRSHYYDDPLVKAVFPSYAQMKTVVQSALQAASFQEEKDADMFGLLTMSRTERTIFTHEQQGDMLVADVAKRAVNFTHHRIVALSPALDTAIENLRKRALEVLARVTMEKIFTIRSTVEELREQQVRLQSLRRIVTGRNHAKFLFAHPTRETEREIERINQQLNEIEGKLEKAGAQLATPKDALKLVRESIGTPDASLVLQRKRLRVDWMNVLLDEQDSSEGNDITLAEFTAGELRRWAVLITFRKRDIQG